MQKNVPAFSRTPAHTNEEKINNQKSKTKLATAKLIKKAHFHKRAPYHTLIYNPKTKPIKNFDRIKQYNR